MRPPENSLIDSFAEGGDRDGREDTLCFEVEALIGSDADEYKQVFGGINYYELQRKFEKDDWTELENRLITIPSPPVERRVRE